MINIPELQKVKTILLKTDGKNPNEMAKAELEALKESIKRFGFTVPIITNNDYVIADGEHRFKAAQLLNMEEVPVIVLPIDEIDRKLLRQVMNKLRGEHNPLLDMEEFKFLDDNNAIPELLALIPNQNKEIKALLDKMNLANKPEELFDADNALKQAELNCTIKPGDIYQLGNNRLMCGDSTNEEDVNILINKEQIDLLFTDPPYGISIVKTNRKIGFGDGSLGFNNKNTSTGTIPPPPIVPVGVYRPIISDDKPFNPSHLIKLGKNQIIWGANYFATKLKESSCWIIWDKRDDIPSNNFADCEIAWTSFEKPARIYRHKWSGLLREGNRHDELIKRVHPTQKPVGLHSDILNDYSKEQDKICDLYGGSGTTLIACEKTNRRCLMMEIDPVYCQVIINRWEKYLGKKAQKLN